MLATGFARRQHTLPLPLLITRKWHLGQRRGPQDAVLAQLVAERIGRRLEITAEREVLHLLPGCAVIGQIRYLHILAQFIHSPPGSPRPGTASKILVIVGRISTTSTLNGKSTGRPYSSSSWRISSMLQTAVPYLVASLAMVVGSTSLKTCWKLAVIQLILPGLDRDVFEQAPLLVVILHQPVDLSVRLNLHPPVQLFVVQQNIAEILVVGLFDLGIQQRP